MWILVMSDQIFFDELLNFGTKKTETNNQTKRKPAFCLCAELFQQAQIQLLQTLGCSSAHYFSHNISKQTDWVFR